MLEKSFRIMHVITGLGTGGAETMLFKLLRSGNRNHFPSIVVSLTDLGTMGKSIKDLGVPVYCLRMVRGQVSFFKLLSLVKLINSNRPSIIVGWMYHANIAALAAKFLARSSAGLIWNIRHTPYDLSSEKRLTACLIRIGAFLSRCPSCILYNSSVSLRRHSTLGFSKKNNHVIPNGFDLEEFRISPRRRRDVRRELGIPEGIPVLGHIARFHPMKDHTGFIMASRQIINKIPDVHFVLVGKDVSYSNVILADLINVNGLKDKMTLLGERPDVSRLLPAFDSVCLTSAWGEGFPNIIGEAMACGITCVTTDVGDAGIVVGETGRVVPKYDPAAFAEACCELLQLGKKEKMALGKAARQRIATYYSLDEVSKIYESVFADVLKDCQT